MAVENLGLLFQCEHVHHLIQSQRRLQFRFYCGYSVLMVCVCLAVFYFCLLVLLFLLFLLKVAYRVKNKHTQLHTFGLLFQCKHLQHLIQSQKHLQSRFYDVYSVLMLFVCLVILLFLFSCYMNVHASILQQYLFPAPS